MKNVFDDEWRLYLSVSNKSLIVLKDLLNKREITPGTWNSANYSMLVKSHLLEKNL